MTTVITNAFASTSHTIMVGEKKIEIFEYPESYRRRHNLKVKYFLNPSNVAQAIGKSEDSIKSFATSEDNRRLFGGIPLERKDLPQLLTAHGFIQPFSLVSAKLYWLQWSVIGNSQALQITRFLMYRPIEVLAARAFCESPDI